MLLHRRYNPEGITRFNVVPGLLGVILTMTMVMMTALAVTRERERGTMENLLAMPVAAIEVMIGKITPYILIGAIQVLVILVAAKILFGVPFEGSIGLFAIATLLFITVNLALGFTFSTVAQNQLQAMQMSFFFLMPSILLSGFAFPFRGMPGWAQAVGEALPVTHFLRIVRGLMLKGASFEQIAGEMAALVLMLVHRRGLGHQPLPRDPGLNRLTPQPRTTVRPRYRSYRASSSSAMAVNAAPAMASRPRETRAMAVPWLIKQVNEGVSRDGGNHCHCTKDCRHPQQH